MELKSLVTFMDKSELTQRRHKIEAINYNQANDDKWEVFPKCHKCNTSNRIVMIPNTDPVLEIQAEKFPNCTKCNTQGHFVVKEVTI